jgi:hypothetical protein
LARQVGTAHAVPYRPDRRAVHAIGIKRPGREHGPDWDMEQSRDLPTKEPT